MMGGGEAGEQESEREEMGCQIDTRRRTGNRVQGRHSRRDRHRHSRSSLAPSSPRMGCRRYRRRGERCRWDCAYFSGSVRTVVERSSDTIKHPPSRSLCTKGRRQQTAVVAMKQSFSLLSEHSSPKYHLVPERDFINASTPGTPHSFNFNPASPLLSLSF